MRRRTMPPTAALLCALTLGAAPASADEAKRDCRQGCQEALRSCKADCSPERDSGTRQESDLYRDCDAGCRGTYESCMDDCASE